MRFAVIKTVILDLEQSGLHNYIVGTESIKDNETQEVSSNQNIEDPLLEVLDQSTCPSICVI